MHLSHLSKSLKISVEVENKRLFFSTNYKEPFPVPHICGVSYVPRVAAVSFFYFIDVDIQFTL